MPTLRSTDPPLHSPSSMGRVSIQEMATAIEAGRNDVEYGTFPSGERTSRTGRCLRLGGAQLAEREPKPNATLKGRIPLSLGPRVPPLWQCVTCGEIAGSLLCVVG